MTGKRNKPSHPLRTDFEYQLRIMNSLAAGYSINAIAEREGLSNRMLSAFAKVVEQGDKDDFAAWCENRYPLSADDNEPDLDEWGVF